jgi:hypothetical protein
VYRWSLTSDWFGYMVFVLDHHILDHINWLNPTTFLWLSQARTWISNIICHGLFLCSVSSVKMKGNCLFCWYWWKWWSSLFRRSFHNKTSLFHKMTFKASVFIVSAFVSLLTFFFIAFQHEAFSKNCICFRNLNPGEILMHDASVIFSYFCFMCVIV